ncbi:hypothetical protein NX059_007616 [Plenodomus lindquistii]|nr:hypothetical protein NX059_007616 [Plenodomus lindquistii]
MMSSQLETFLHVNSEKGLSSVSTLIIGAKNAVLIDPPVLLPDAEDIVQWIKSKTSCPLSALFVTHHHPDHYFAANPILDAFPTAKFLTAPYVRAGIDLEFDAKLPLLQGMFPGQVAQLPRKPDPYPFSFFNLVGNEASPVFLLGPVQGDSVDHCLFWLPSERTLICGDTVYARSTHVWVEEVESAALLDAWESTLNLIESLSPTKVITGHLEKGWELDSSADIAHTRKYLALFRQAVTENPKKLSMAELQSTFTKAFPVADKNIEFFVGQMSNNFGSDGTPWEENRMHKLDERKLEDLEGYRFG